jgi:hypothetical protein
MAFPKSVSDEIWENVFTITVTSNNDNLSHQGNFGGSKNQRILQDLNEEEDFHDVTFKPSV